MIITKMALPRRTFLRGMGTVVALPLLDAMVPSRWTTTALATSAASPVRRLGFVYMPMGCDLPRWTPPGTTLTRSGARPRSAPSSRRENSEGVTTCSARRAISGISRRCQAA